MLHNKHTQTQRRYIPPKHHPSFQSSTLRKEISESMHEVIDLTNDNADSSSQSILEHTELGDWSKTAAAAAQKNLNVKFTLNNININNNCNCDNNNELYKNINCKTKQLWKYSR